MPARNRFVLACVAFVCVCGQVRPADEKGIKPIAQLRLRSLDSLMEDLKFLGNLTDNGALLGAVEQQLRQWFPRRF